MKKINSVKIDFFLYGFTFASSFILISGLILGYFFPFIPEKEYVFIPCAENDLQCRINQGGDVVLLNKTYFIDFPIQINKPVNIYGVVGGNTSIFSITNASSMFKVSADLNVYNVNILAIGTR